MNPTQNPDRPRNVYQLVTRDSEKLTCELNNDEQAIVDLTGEALKQSMDLIHETCTRHGIEEDTGLDLTLVTHFAKHIAFETCTPGMIALRLAIKTEEEARQALNHYIEMGVWIGMAIALEGELWRP